MEDCKWGHAQKRVCPSCSGVPLILDKNVRATAGVNRREGSGQAEAPRGVLNHHYRVDEGGKIQWANLDGKALRQEREIYRRRAEPR
jgi:hypothetical protein